MSCGAAELSCREDAAPRRRKNAGRVVNEHTDEDGETGSARLQVRFREYRLKAGQAPCRCGRSRDGLKVNNPGCPANRGAIPRIGITGADVRPNWKERAR
jgi:hypothetical protein